MEIKHPIVDLRKWYVIKTNVHSEIKVHDRLEKDGFEIYLPLIKTIKIWSDRKKKVTKPLIASTLFIHVSHKDLRYIYPYQGVHSVLTYLGKPAVVKDHEINNLRLLLQENSFIDVESTTEFVAGETVQVIRGSFQGMIGTAIETEKRFRLLIDIQSLGTGFVVNVPKNCVRKLKN